MDRSSHRDNGVAPERRDADPPTADRSRCRRGRRPRGPGPDGDDVRTDTRGGTDTASAALFGGVAIGLLLLLFGAVRMVSGALGEGFLVMLVGLVSIFGAFALAIVAELGRADSPEQREAILRFAELFFGKSVGGGRTGGGQTSGSQPDGGQTSVSATDRQPTHTSEGTSDEGVLGFSGFTNIGNSDPSSSGLIDKYQAIRNAPQYPSSPKCPRCETQKVRSIDDGVWQCSNGHTFETNPSHKREYDINVQHDE